jgi:hypothetical protein
MQLSITRIRETNLNMAEWDSQKSQRMTEYGCPAFHTNDYLYSVSVYSSTRGEFSITVTLVLVFTLTCLYATLAPPVPLWGTRRQIDITGSSSVGQRPIAMVTTDMSQVEVPVEPKGPPIVPKKLLALPIHIHFS